MRWLFTISFAAVATAVVSAFSAIAEPARFEHPLDEVRLKAAEYLSRGLDSISKQDGSAQEQADSMLSAIEQARRLLGDDSPVAKRLEWLASRWSDAAAKPNAQDIAILTGQLRELISDLRFRPRKEADLPQGFPPPTPVGHIEVKHYPEYRKAYTDRSSNAAFWLLFAHIKRNNISMTAPVEMMSSADDAESVPAATMAFLYENPDQGKLAKDGAVQVADTPAMTVVSIGLRGRQTQQAIHQAKKTLESWLEARQKQWVVAGPLRVMAYNSPFVPRNENFFEVQIPIISRDSETSVIRTNDNSTSDEQGANQMSQSALKVGAKAPAFSLLNQDGNKVSLKDFAGKWVVVYFYPKDDTPGCTTEACEFTDQLKHFEKLGATVLGVSPDSVESHQKFRAKHKLQVELLSDPDAAVAKKYGAWGQKSMYGKTYEGIIRSTFLVNPEGKIAHIWPKVTPAGHAEEVRQKLAELQSASSGAPTESGKK